MKPSPHPLTCALLAAALIPMATRASSPVYLDALDLSQVESAPGLTRANRSFDNKPLTIQGVVFPHGIGTHANGDIRLALDGQAVRFTAKVGVDDEAEKSYASAIFRVIGDGKTLWQSPVLHRNTKPLEVDVSLAGIKNLALTCDDGSSYTTSDHVDWVEATITYDGAAPVVTNGRVRLEMADSVVAFRIRGDKLYETYFGARPATATDLPDSGAPAYPTQWDAPEGVNAISIIQADGRISLDLICLDSQLKNLDENRSELSFRLADPAYPVEVDLHYLAYKRENVVQRWSVIRNLGTGDVQIDHAASGFLNVGGNRQFLTSFSGTWGGEALMHEEALQPGIKELQSITGTSTSQLGQPAFILSMDGPANEDSGNVILGALAWSGNWRLRFEKRADDTLAIDAGYNPYLARYRLAKGEALETPRLILTGSSHGKGEASRNLHRWARAYGIRGGDEPRRVLLNSWEGAYFTFDDALIKRMITDAAKTGIELFVLDDGWFGRKYPRNNSRAGLGDWVVNTNKLKGGLQGLIDHAKKEGIDFGIWVEPEMVNPASELYEQHPDWVIELPHRTQRLQRTQLDLDLANPAVQDYIVRAMDELLTQHPGISYVKWDCNRSISDPGSSYLAADRQEQLWIKYVKGYYDVLRRITEKHPKVTFQVCGSGGGRTDYGSLQYHHEAWTSDNTDARERIRMQWSLNQIYPAIITAAHVTEVPNQETGRSTPIKYRFDVAMTGRLGFEMRPERVPAADMEFSKKALEVYKGIRPIVQFGDLYRLRSPFEGNLAALMYVLDGRGQPKPLQAVFFAFTLEKDSLTSFGNIQLRGLNAAKRYQLTEINLTQPNSPLTRYHGQILGGDFLMTEGLQIPWKSGDYQSVVIKIEEAGN